MEVRKVIAKMQNDFKESLMAMCKGNLVEYKELIGLSCEDFFVRYKLFIDEIVSKNGN